MRTEKVGEHVVRIMGGTDREGGGEGPLVVLMHGFGAPGDDLVGLYRVMDVDRSVRFAFPEAPLELPGTFGQGRAWWMIDMAKLDHAMRTGQIRNMKGEVPEGLEPARVSMLKTLDALCELLNVPDGELVLGGFSQGGMLATDLALHTEKKVAALGIMSGTYLAAEVWDPLMKARSGLPVFQSHGTHDPLLPFSVAEELRDALRAQELEVDFLSFPGGHEIPMPVLESLMGLIRKSTTAQ